MLTGLLTLSTNLAKHEFGHVAVSHVVDQTIKCQIILEYPTKRELMRFLEIVGYHWCQNFSIITAPLTNLLTKNQEIHLVHCLLRCFLWKWNLFSSLTQSWPFLLMVDASDIGTGAVFVYIRGIIQPGSLALVLALQHFDVYLNTTQCSILVFTDHNPLTFIPEMKNHNQQYYWSGSYYCRNIILTT